jgi:hypothetical protein
MRNKLIAKIKITQKNIGMSDDAYRGMLQSLFSVDSCTKLTDPQKIQLIDHMKNPVGTPSKTSFIKITNDMPHAREKRRILALWKALGWKMESIHLRCKTQFGVERFEDLEDAKDIQTFSKDLTNRAARKGVLK